MMWVYLLIAWWGELWLKYHPSRQNSCNYIFNRSLIPRARFWQRLRPPCACRHMCLYVLLQVLCQGWCVLISWRPERGELPSFITMHRVCACVCRCEKEREWERERSEIHGLTEMLWYIIWRSRGRWEPRPAVMCVWGCGVNAVCVCVSFHCDHSVRLSGGCSMRTAVTGSCSETGRQHCNRIVLNRVHPCGRGY